MLTGIDSLTGYRLDNSWIKHNIAMLRPKIALIEVYFFG
jgi:hypothetical protein